MFEFMKVEYLEDRSTLDEIYRITFKGGKDALTTTEIETAIRNYLSCRDEPGESPGEQDNILVMPRGESGLIETKKAFDVCYEAIEMVATPEGRTQVARSLSTWYREG